MSLKNAQVLALNVVLMSKKEASGFTHLWCCWNEPKDSSYRIASGRRMAEMAPVMELEKAVRFKNSDQTPERAIPRKEADGFTQVGRYNVYKLGETIFVKEAPAGAAIESIAMPEHLDFRR